MAVVLDTLPLTLEDYLELPEDDDREREIIRGRLFVAPRPHFVHQLLLSHLHELLTHSVLRRGGERLQVIPDVDLLIDEVGTYISPDLMYFAASALPALRALRARRRRIHVSQARPDLVVEIVSPGSEERDLVEKARDYAAVGIPHYWALDPERRELHELVLPPDGGEYTRVTHSGERVQPRLFAGEEPPFELDLAALWQDTLE